MTRKQAKQMLDSTMVQVMLHWCRRHTLLFSACACDPALSGPGYCGTDYPLTCIPYLPSTCSALQEVGP